MPGASSRGVNGQLRAIFAGGTAGQLGDEQLLARFLAGRGEASEAAFAALVERHGGMVLGVCRRVLGDRHAAEDAFQAVFLVLARKASAVVRGERLYSWLYKVALRTAREARGREARRRAGERRVRAMTPTGSADGADTTELRSILDDELARLPEDYRSAVLLCELEGLSRREAADRLGIPEGTLSSRLTRAKARLREALARRGLAPSAAALAALLAREAGAAAVPPKLVESTARTAALVAAGIPAAGLVSIPVATLVEGVLKAMFIAKLRGAALGLVALALVATAVTATSGQDGPGRGSLEQRIDGVERKLDRILEALGNPHPGGGPRPQLGVAEGTTPVATTSQGFAAPPGAGLPGESGTVAVAPAVGPAAELAGADGTVATTGAPTANGIAANAQGGVGLSPAAARALADHVLELDRRLERLEQIVAKLSREVGRRDSSPRAEGPPAAGGPPTADSRPRPEEPPPAAGEPPSTPRPR